jgi:CRP-like cAMP-binding protein
MNDPARQSLAGILILSGLTPERRAAVERRCRWRHYRADEQIIDRESDARDVYFVVSGLTRVVNYSVAGREVTFDEIGTGGCFGEMAALDGAPRSASVVAAKDSLTASLSPDAFIELATSDPGIALAVMRRLTSVIRVSTDRVMDLSTLGANNRVYGEILRLAGGAKAASPAAIRPLPHHADIAARVSTTRETVARALTVLKQRKIARDLEGKTGLEIMDIDRLAEMVHEFRD